MFDKRKRADTRRIRGGFVLNSYVEEAMEKVHDVPGGSGFRNRNSHIVFAEALLSMNEGMPGELAIELLSDLYCASVDEQLEGEW